MNKPIFRTRQNKKSAPVEVPTSKAGPMNKIMLVLLYMGLALLMIPVVSSIFVLFQYILSSPATPFAWRDISLYAPHADTNLHVLGDYLGNAYIGYTKDKSEKLLFILYSNKINYPRDLKDDNDFFQFSQKSNHTNMLGVINRARFFATPDLELPTPLFNYVETEYTATSTIPYIKRAGTYNLKTKDVIQFYDTRRDDYSLEALLHFAAPSPDTAQVSKK